MKENSINDNNSGQNSSGFLNKKRKENKDDKVVIDNIRRLIKESGIDKEILIKKLFSESEKGKQDCIKEEKNINKKKDIKLKENKNKIQRYNPLREWYQKINFLPTKDFNDISNNDISLEEDLNWFEDISHINNIVTEDEKGVIKFNGYKNNNKPYPHYIFLKDSYSFDISPKNKIYWWKIHFLSTSNLIGIGLAYKNIVLKNGNKFLDDVNNFNNGVFALIQTYNPKIKKHCIRPWNCQDKTLVNHVAEFPSFKKGKEILIKYDTNKERIEFKIKKNIHIMGGIKLNGMDNKIMTPCAIFYYEGDEVEFSEFTTEDENINNNINTNSCENE